MTTLLKQNISKHISLSEKEAEEFSALFRPQTIPKKGYFLKEGDVCKFEGFVNKGLFKVYLIDEKGFEQILSFPREDWWIGDIDSFINQSPSHYFIQAIEHSEILVISKEDKERLYQNIPKVERLFRIMGQKSLIALHRRMSENLRKTADRRYIDFIEKNARLSQRLTNLQIASYLGISHEFVSKIRRKISLKK